MSMIPICALQDGVKMALRICHGMILCNVGPCICKHVYAIEDTLVLRSSFSISLFIHHFMFCLQSSDIGLKMQLLIVILITASVVFAGEYQFTPWFLIIVQPVLIGWLVRLGPVSVVLWQNCSLISVGVAKADKDQLRSTKGPTDSVWSTSYKTERLVLGD